MAMASEAPQLSEAGRSSFEKSKFLRILITGRTGVGKSALVNSIIGRVVAQESTNPPDPETLEVTTHRDTILGVETIVYDSPGLQDGIINEEAYMKDLERKCRNGVDLIIYCVKMTEPMGEGEYRAILKLSNAFGMDDFWRNALFALTFANKVELPPPSSESCTQQPLSEYFEIQMAEWKTKLRKALASERIGIKQEIVNTVPIIPAGYRYNLSLPNVQYWASDLWFHCLTRIKEIAKPALLKINWDRLRASQEVKEEDVSQHNWLIVLTRDKVVPFLKEISGYFLNISPFIGNPKAELEEAIPKLRSLSLTPESRGEHIQERMNKRHVAPTTFTIVGKVFGQCLGGFSRGGTTGIFEPETTSMHEADGTENHDQDIDELQEDCATGVQVPISQQDDAAIENSAGSRETHPSLDDRPRLAQLDCFRGKKFTLNVIDRVSTKWRDVGILLDFDDDGTKINAIAVQHAEHPKDCCVAMFQHWLNGNGIHCSWRNLIEIIEDCKLQRLADDIQEFLSTENC